MPHTIIRRTGRVGKMIPQVGDADEVWYDAGLNRYYFAHSLAGAAEAESGAIGVVDAAGELRYLPRPRNLPECPKDSLPCRRARGSLVV